MGKAPSRGQSRCVELGAAGCAAVSAEAGLGVPTVDELTLLPGSASTLEGTVSIAENGCFHLVTEDGTYFIVWPADFQQDADQVFVQLGEAFSDGDAVSGTARILDVPSAVTAADGPDGYIASVTGYCVEESEQIAAFSEIESA